MIRRASAFALLFLAAAAGIRAQDERRVASPDGQIEFRAFLTHPQPAAFVRMAYQIYYRDKRIINTSFLGLYIHDQPTLGENVGLTASHTESTPAYRGLVAEYMQNGSLGRRITLEVRVYNDGVAFRYQIPKSGPLERMNIEDEATEFEPMEDAPEIGRVSAESLAGLPFVAEQPGLGWIAINEVRAGDYPRMKLARSEGRILVTHLPLLPHDLHNAWTGTTPMTGPWRVLNIGPTRESVLSSKLLDSLNP
jgi:alpha-glucosidase